MRVFQLSAALFLALFSTAYGQDCPKASSTGPSVQSATITLSGTAVYHDDLRGWLELKMSAPVCGTSSIQLLTFDKSNASKMRELETYRGCNLTVTGTLDFAPTGYYSADIFMNVAAMKPAKECVRQARFPDYSHAKPAKGIVSYKVVMNLNYAKVDDSISITIESNGKELRPWQAYADYMLTGDFVLYGLCAKHFVVGEISGPPGAVLGHFGSPGEKDDMASFDPETPASKGIRHMVLGYTCLRK